MAQISFLCRVRLARTIVLLALLMGTRSAHAFVPPTAGTTAGTAGTADASKAIASFRPASGVKVEPYAAEPLLANPVAFGFDEKGRIYVVETYRLHKGVTDNRGHMNWLEDDLASRTVADRVAMYRKYLGKDLDSYATEEDRIKLVEDRDGDGKADYTTVFADGFKGLASGLASGVLAHKGNVYFTDIPDLWLLRDTNGDGKADLRRSFHQGYGVHVAFLGHDLHGLTIGPDGKLYFSIGDRGLNVKTKEGRTLFAPDTGSVLRCDLDGSNLEIFATGLRNPQELAFDESGNVFTVDNNSDSGDRARLVYVMEGSDSGWRMGYQYLEKPVSRGPWNAEKLWYPSFDGQAADILPPIANLSDGPSGLTYNPGATLLPEKYQGHFFLADFRGASGTSGIRSFSVKPKGAGFALGESDEFLWGVLATDVDFGPDGCLYVSDWTEGWEMPGKGRIYKVSEPGSPRAKLAGETRVLLAEGFDGKSVDSLVRLLAHADRRVRQEAQFALATKGPEGLAGLVSVARDTNQGRLPRLHATWGLGQVGRSKPEALTTVRGLLTDNDAEVRAQAAKILGDSRDLGSLDGLISLLHDREPRVVSLAAIALTKLRKGEAVSPLFEVIARNADKDPYLRHALIFGLEGSGEPATIALRANDPSRSVRLAALLALRRRNSPEVVRFLNDADNQVATEAARAIYDASIDTALPALASLVEKPGLSEPTRRRAIAAAERVGGADRAKALAAFAARSDAPEMQRVEALDALKTWPKATGADRITGLWRPRQAHLATEAAEAVLPVFADMINGKSDPVRLAAARLAGPLPLSSAAPSLLALSADTKRPAAARSEALKALDRLGDARISEAVTRAMKDPDASVRVDAQRLLAKLNPTEALPLLKTVLDSGSLREKQGAFDTLGSMLSGQADRLIGEWLDRLIDHKVAPELELDLVEAARSRKDQAIASKLATIESALPKDDPLAPYRSALVGGSAERGAAIVAEKAAVSCVRCHKINGQGGEVGPDLTGVGSRQDRRYLLESIVTPSKQIAKGFETLIVATTDGQLCAGIVKESTDSVLKLITAEGQIITIAKSEIEEQKRGASAMPEDLTKQLSRHELRDVVEYLASLKK